MRLSLLVDQALDLIFQHPIAAAGFAVGAAVLSWLATRTRGSI